MDVRGDYKIEERSHATLISEAVRKIRKHRRMKPSEVAAAMGIPVRTYEHFEAGTGRITYARILRFAHVTDSDPVAILAVIFLRSTDFALRCADSKLMSIVIMTLRELDHELGPDLEYLSARTLVGALDKLGKDLVDHVQRRDLFAERWLEEKASKIDGAAFPPRPKKD